jgi:hypothetical protein
MELICIILGFSKRLTEWLSGSGGTGETPSQLCTISGKIRLRASGRAAVRLEPVLGGN